MTRPRPPAVPGSGEEVPDEGHPQVAQQQQAGEADEVVPVPVHSVTRTTSQCDEPGGRRREGQAEDECQEVGPVATPGVDEHGACRHQGRHEHEDAGWGDHLGDLVDQFRGRARDGGGDGVILGAKRLLVRRSATAPAARVAQCSGGLSTA